MDEVLTYLDNNDIDRYGGYSRGTSIFGPDGGAAYTFSFLYMPLIRLAIDRYNAANVDNPIVLPAEVAAAPVSDAETVLFNNNFNNTINILVDLMREKEALRNMLEDNASWDGPQHLQNLLQEAHNMNNISSSHEVTTFMERYYARVAERRAAAAEAAAAVGAARTDPEVFRAAFDGGGWMAVRDANSGNVYYSNHRHPLVLGGVEPTVTTWNQIDVVGWERHHPPPAAARGRGAPGASARGRGRGRGAAATTSAAGADVDADIQQAILNSINQQGGRKTKRYKRNGKAGGKRRTLKGGVSRGATKPPSPSKLSRKTGGRRKRRIKGKSNTKKR